MLQQRGERVLEVSRPKRPAHRTGAKSDTLDAVRAAREALGQDRLAIPRRRGEREALRVLLTTRRSATTARVAAIGQLKALIVAAPEELRDELRGRSTAHQIQHCASLRARPARSLEHQVTVRALRTTAARIQFLAAEADQLQAELATLVGAVAPWLLEVPGVGPGERRPGPGQLVASRTPPLRSRLRGPGRGQPDPRRLRAGDPLPPPTAAATGSSTAPCTPSCWCAYAPTPTPAPTWPGAPPRARAAATPSGASGASSPGSCSGCWSATASPASKSPEPLDST
jgi:hypothetical protein